MNQDRTSPDAIHGRGCAGRPARGADRGVRHALGGGAERDPRGEGGANTIVIRSFSFQPARLAVAKGATVTVTNADHVTHTLTSRDGSFDTRQLGAGKSARFVVHRSGTFPFACQIHPFMHGTLVVR